VSGSGLKRSNNPPVFITRDTVKFLVQESGFRQIFDVPEYRFDDLYPTDRVIDIGANVGAFCIRASRFSHHVVAVEPLTATLLRENIHLNGVSVQVIEGALGDGKSKTIWWDDNNVFTQTYALRNIIEMAGGCDFLKCDCEGAEWSIAPEDLDEVRHIEMELHLPPISGPPNPALLDYISRHYHFEIERKPVHAALGVMGVLHAERNV
jgi:FkbM family methyltransferase